MSADGPDSEGQEGPILILGGTAEALAIATDLVARGHDVITSLAGRTENPVVPPGRLRIGGFGGWEGLAAYLVAERIARVIDATHPFALKISENARLACRHAGVPLEIPSRSSWTQMPGDRWIGVGSTAEAAAALPPQSRVFLALGRQYLDAFVSRPDCHFVIRMVDPPQVPLSFAQHELLLGKPAPSAEAEAELMQRYGITCLVCRNSGGAASYRKISAARALELPVIIITRPDRAEREDG